MSPRIKVMEAALAELKNLHDDHPHACPGPNNCPTARAIRDFEILIGEEKIEICESERFLSEARASDAHATGSGMRKAGEFMPGEVRVDLRGNGAEATYPAMTIKDIDPHDVACALNEAQAGLGRPRVARLCIDCDEELPATTPITENRCEKCL